MRRRTGPIERGSATAEFAVVLPAVLLVLVLGVWAVAAVAAQLRCADAAAVGARALARGESAQTVSRVVAQMAPPGAEVTLGRDGDLVVVSVRATVSLPGPWRRDGPGLRVGDRAVALAEGDGEPP